VANADAERQALRTELKSATAPEDSERIRRELSLADARFREAKKRSSELVGEATSDPAVQAAVDEVSALHDAFRSRSRELEEGIVGFISGDGSYEGMRDSAKAWLSNFDALKRTVRSRRVCV
jgi:hypothetical protein